METGFAKSKKMAAIPQRKKTEHFTKTPSLL
jgi:hypothetical protein